MSNLEFVICIALCFVPFTWFLWFGAAIVVFFVAALTTNFIKKIILLQKYPRLEHWKMINA